MNFKIYFIKKLHKYIQMNTLAKTIQTAVEKSVSQSINNLFEKIVDRWEDIDLEELQVLWNEDDNNIKVSKTSTKTKTSPSKKKKDDENKENDDDDGGCPYIFAKGEKEGTICGSNPKSGCEYCSRHQKFEGVGQDIKKKTPKTKTSSIGDKTTSSTKPKASPSKKPLERIIKLNKDINKFWNAETQLVFKSKDERVVYATYRDDVLTELNDDDIILCEQYGFKYEKTSLEEEEDEVEDKKPETKKVEDKKAETKKVEDKKAETKKVEEKKKPETKKVEEKKAETKKVEEKKPEIKKVEEKKVEEKKVEEKKVEEKKPEIKKVEEKKSLTCAINENNIKAKDIENILNELQLSNDNDDEDDEFVEEEVDEEEEEDE